MKLVFSIFPTDIIKYANSNDLSKIAGSIGITDIKSPNKPYTNSYKQDNIGIFSGTISDDMFYRLNGIYDRDGHKFVYNGVNYHIVFIGPAISDGGGRRRTRKTRRVKRKVSKAKKSRQSRQFRQSRR